MATTLIEQWNAHAGATVFGADVPQSAKDVDAFRSRVSMAMVAAGIAIQNEGADKAYHEPRARLAKLVLGDPTNCARPFAQAVASQGLDNSSTDQQIKDAVSSVWNAISGLS